MTERSHAVFLSYASQDAEAAQKICEALRAAAIEVWFDQSELRGGDAWDRSIRKHIKTCVLFIPVISRHTHERDEGYFRLEWKLAVDRSHLMTGNKAFLLPVVIDDTRDDDENVPEKFREVQWTRLLAGETPPAFVQRVQRLVSPEPSHGPATTPLASAVSGAANGTAELARAPRRWKAVPLGILALAVVGLGYVVADRLLRSKHPVEASAGGVPAAQVAAPATATFSPPPHSIAVLPFVDMSEKKDQEYFSDGLSEELIDMLTKIPGLRVPARTSTFYFKGKAEDIQTIAKRLMVAHVLEGSVRKAGKHVRITAQLIRTDNGYHLWSETYDRQLDDIFKIQDEIASAVAHALEASLAERSVPRAGMHNADAYQLYLQAQFLHRRASTPADFRRITDYLQQSLKLDPEFAPAWAYLSSMLLATCGDVGCEETVEAARRAAARALALDPTLPSAHTASAKIRLLHEWDWKGAQSEANRALELDPGDVNALGWSGYVAWAFGDIEKTLEFLQRQVALDPLNPHSWVYLAKAFIDAGRLEDAQTALHNAGDLNPTEQDLHVDAAEIMLRKGQLNAALAEISQDSDEKSRTHIRACVYYALGRQREADAALADLQNKFGQEAAESIASVYAFRGELDQGFKWLDRAYQRHEEGLTWVKGDSAFKNLWPDPRWKAFLRKMKLPD